MTTPAPAETRELVGADGKPLRSPKGPCPRCGAPASDRTASAGFGRQVDELCGRCGFRFGAMA